MKLISMMILVTSAILIPKENYSLQYATYSTILVYTYFRKNFASKIFIDSIINIC